MIVGVHARNESYLKPQDANAIKTLHGAAIVFWYQNAGDLIQNGVIPANSVVRLQDSVYKKPDGTDYIPHYVTYATDLTRTIRYFYQFGFRRFVIDNEPNLTWPKLKKDSSTYFSAWDWSLFLLNVMVGNVVGVLHNIPADVILIFPPFSQPMQSVEWIDASESRGLINLFHDVAAHCYWQAASDMYSTVFGAGFKWLHEKTGKNIYILEAANSKIQSPTHPPLGVIRVLQQQQYPAYIKYVNSFSYVKSIYFYILGGTPEWEGFYLTPEIIGSIVNVTNSLPHNLGNGVYAV